MTKSEHINEYYNGRSFMLLCAVAMVAAMAQITTPVIRCLASSFMVAILPFRRLSVGATILSRMVDTV